MKVGSQSGFTLIEAMTAGLISTIFAGALISMLLITNSQIKAGTLHLKAGQMQTVVSDQLRASAAKASGVKALGEDLTDPFTAPAYAVGAGPTTRIIFCDRNGIPLTAYNINTVSNYLEEWLEAIPGIRAAGYYAFTVGSDTAFLDGATSRFTLNPGRIGFSTNLVFTSPDRSYTFPSLVELMRCRNPQ